MTGVFTAECIRKAREEGKITEEEASKKLKVYEFLSLCDKQDIIELFDSGVFNEIVINMACKVNGAFGVQLGAYIREHSAQDVI